MSTKKKKTLELYLNFAPLTSWWSDELHHECVSLFSPMAPFHPDTCPMLLGKPLIWCPLSSAILSNPPPGPYINQTLPSAHFLCLNLFPQDSFYILFIWNLTTLEISYREAALFFLLRSYLKWPKYSCSFLPNSLLLFKTTSSWDFPGGRVVNNLPAKVGDTSSTPGLEWFHMPWGNQSPCAATTEACVPRAWVPRREKPLQGEALAPQLEKATKTQCNQK